MLLFNYYIFYSSIIHEAKTRVLVYHYRQYIQKNSGSKHHLWFLLEKTTLNVKPINWEPGPWFLDDSVPVLPFEDPSFCIFCNLNHFLFV